MSDIRKKTGKKGTSYQVRFRAGENYKYQTFTRRRDAQDFLENLSQRKNVNTNIRRVSEAVDKWLDVCEHEGRDGEAPISKSTLATYRLRAKIIKAYEWEKDIQDLKRPDAVNFRSWLIGNYSRYQANKALSSFHSVIIEMIHRGHLGHDPAVGVTVKLEDIERDIPSKAEIREILAAADRLANSTNEQTSRTWERYRPLVRLAADSGLRPQEYVALPKENVLHDGVKVTQALKRAGGIGTVKTKAGRRHVYVSDNTLDMVRHYIKKRDNPLVFGTSNGNPVLIANIRTKCWLPVCKEAGLMVGDAPKYTLYSLRHFYASALIDANKGLKYIQTQMGHSNVNTTLNIYGHLLKDSADKSSGGALAGL